MSYNEILKDLCKQSYSVKARLQSILFDHQYVSQFTGECIVANERCGLWYIDQSEEGHSAYFKSTDGHTGEWKFSMRRLNFHLLPLLQEFRNLVLVDSTRKGKLIPDALLKTVPIWCAVLSYIMFEDEIFDSEQLVADNWLLTPREMVSRSEHAAIVKTIPVHAAQVKQLGLINKESLVARLGREAPILPLWLYPGKHLQSPGFCVDAFTVCCLTTSYKVSPGYPVPGWNFSLPYVQGAGDDHELWAAKDLFDGELTPRFFWSSVVPEKSEDLRITDENGDICSWVSEQKVLIRLGMIHAKAARSLDASLGERLDLYKLGHTGITVGSIQSEIPYAALGVRGNFAAAIVLSERYKIVDVPEDCARVVRNYQVESSKKGSKKIREILPRIMAELGPIGAKQILIVCDSGTDLSVAVALCVLCLNYDSNWNLQNEQPRVNKDVVKQHLALISEHCRANPSRNSLQSVNACLMK
ncbi:initiator tRNA phosphoribosyl transferase [Metschnikowia bicuspidata]|uniref:Initiator tRNA phosphoribosyl transferase n=1 Tax=Metschnikowia bicuspidata TaxID=27322 RepID=A0A4P9ZCR1_9ASCO|nr:initiator tRNA phosphoribosyl transferase [Metschnikowia bicuspidata]